MIELRSIDDIRPDETNPRTPDPARLHLLKLSLTKLGFILPVAITEDGLILSGHQRTTVAKGLGMSHVPVQVVSIQDKDIKGINMLFNRVTNDFGAQDTGSEALGDLHLTDIVARAEKLPDVSTIFAGNCKMENITKIGKGIAERYDKKAVVIAENFIRKGIQIPLVLSESGTVVNGVHRLFAALENGVKEWPVVRIPDELAEFAVHFLNYLSMDFHVDEEFADMLRYSAYRRPQNNRGSVPKAYRFWGNGEKTLPDKDSYTTGYWRNFRDLHGLSIIDFGAGLGKVAPYLQTKGIDCIDFEPYRIDPSSGVGKPNAEYSRVKAREFLKMVEDSDRVFDSIFLASVLNSIPFPKDRMAVLAIVHSLCGYNSAVYGTCRDISDFNYEYGGIRQANYFVFDSEPGVRLGDSLANPKIQKFHTQDEVKTQFSFFWNTVDFWGGGNVFYWRAKSPKRINPKVLGQALEIEFNLPYADGSTMNLVKEAKKAFGKRLGVKIP
jgi:hypothetical protein